MVFVKGHPSYLNEESRKKISSSLRKFYTKKWVTLKCLTCGSKFKTTKGRLYDRRGKRRRFCTKRCAYKSPQRSLEIRLRHSREGNPNWRGGKSPVRLSIWKSKEYQEWRKAVFERDNYTCVKCGVGGTLNADHFPKTFADLLEEFSIETVLQASGCSELWSLENGRTLCIDCHRKTDTWGFKNPKTRAKL